MGDQIYSSIKDLVNEKVLVRGEIEIESHNSVDSVNKKCYMMWVPVSSTDKVYCSWVRDMGSNPAYTKN